MRKILFIIPILILFSISAKAQLGYGYHPIDIGFGFGLTKAYGDIETTKNTGAAYLNVGYNFSPFTNFIVEYQNGKLAGGDALLTKSGREFVNKYSSVAFRTQFQAGEFINYSKSPLYNALKNFYVGAGVGVIFNKITEINRESIQIPGFFSNEGKDKSEEVFIPVRFGYEFKFYNSYNEPNIKLDLGYQHQFILGDNMDGFEAGAYNDTFSQIFVGVKFGIGGTTSYRKPIAYQ